VEPGDPEYGRFRPIPGPLQREARRHLVLPQYVARAAEDFRAGNREVAKYADKYKGRFRGSCVITPFQIEEALREIEDCRKQLGFVWLGETCNYMTGYKYESPEWTRVMQLAQSLNYVIQIHTTTAEMRYLAETFPKATIVFPHFGPSKEQIFERISIVAQHPNTYLEISGSGVERVGILEKAVKEIGSERVLYGSDFTINEPSAVIARVKNAFITAEERDNILFRNLEKLLKKAG
jgi:predicted TIM-barrel fold metal-dependent hydrolase